MCTFFQALRRKKKIKGVLVSFDFLNEFLYFFFYFLFLLQKVKHWSRPHLKALCFSLVEFRSINNRTKKLIKKCSNLPKLAIFFPSSLSLSLHGGEIE